GSHQHEHDKKRNGSLCFHSSLQKKKRNSNRTGRDEGRIHRAIAELQSAERLAVLAPARRGVPRLPERLILSYLACVLHPRFRLHFFFWRRRSSLPARLSIPRTPRSVV